MTSKLYAVSSSTNKWNSFFITITKTMKLWQNQVQLTLFIIQIIQRESILMEKAGLWNKNTHEWSHCQSQLFGLHLNNSFFPGRLIILKYKLESLEYTIWFKNSFIQLYNNTVTSFLSDSKSHASTHIVNSYLMQIFKHDAMHLTPTLRFKFVYYVDADGEKFKVEIMCHF